MKAIAIASALLWSWQAQAHSTTWPDTCREGFVWRQAVPGDHVCVPPATRARAADDNRHAAQRRAAGAGEPGTGPCGREWVRRAASPGDDACVTPEARAEAMLDNELAERRRVPPQTRRPFARVAQASAN